MTCLLFFIIFIYFTINFHEVLSISNFYQSHVYSSQELRRMIRDFFFLKVGQQQKQSVWYYTGVMKSSLNGNNIAGIEGVELVSALEQEPRRFQVGNSSEETYEQSYLSKKMFVYVKKDNLSIPYTEHRMRHHAPLRKVNPIKSFSEKISISGSSNEGLHASIEWPGSKRTMRTSKISISQSPQLSWMDRQLGRRKLQVANFMSAVPCPPTRKAADSRLQAIAKWVSFSPTGASQTSGRTQEFYTISNAEIALAPQTAPSPADRETLLETSTKMKMQNQQSSILQGTVTGNDNNLAGYRSRNSRLFNILPTWLASLPPKPEAVLEYRRYGESPAWYALGQPCAIELRGYRYPHVRCLPSRVLSLVQTVDPTFFHTTPCSTNSSTDMASAEEKDLLTMDWFSQQIDPADNYRPWYSGAMQRWCTLWSSLIKRRDDYSVDVKP